MKKILLSLAFLAGVSLTVSAQFKIGGKTINTKKVINAATDVAHAATLSDEDVAKMAKEYIQWMDTHNEVAGPDTEMGQRLERVTVSGTVSKLTDSQLGDMAQALAGAQYSQKQEYEADEFGFQFCIDYGRDPYGMSNSLNKLLQLSESEAKSSKFMQMFSSHPETQKRADRVKEKADEYVKSKQ